MNITKKALPYATHYCESQPKHFSTTQINSTKIEKSFGRLTKINQLKVKKRENQTT